MRFPVIILVCIIAMSAFAPVFAPFDPVATQPETSLTPPSTDHLLGTDLLGRDVFSRVLYGGRKTLAIASLATVISMLPGVLVGLMLGFIGGWIDRVGMVLVNSLLAFPALMLALVIVTILGQGSLQIAIATGVAQIATYTQVVRSATKLVRSSGYVISADALGSGAYGVIYRHIIPNIIPTLLGFGGVIFSYNLLNVAALSFLGLSGSLSEPDWGVMLSEGRATFLVAPWVSIAPGILITVTVYCINRIADHLSQVRGVM